MSDDQKGKRLGRGLSALLGETEFDPAEVPGPSDGLTMLPIEYLQRNPDQPRRHFDEDDLNDLAKSIKKKGILQPIVVRPLKDEASSYQIVAGERRWRAAQLAAQHEVPVIIKDLTDSETMEIALIENVQRADLNPIEEAMGYKSLMDNFDYTQKQLAKDIGKSRPHIANMVRLLSLPDGIQKQIRNGTLSAGHGRALLAAEKPGELADIIVDQGLNVRQTEELVKKPKKASATSSTSSATQKEKDADTIALENNVSSMLGLRIEINHRGDAGGNVVVKYKTLEQLDDICRRLSSD